MQMSTASTVCLPAMVLALAMSGTGIQAGDAPEGAGFKHPELRVPKLSTPPKLRTGETASAVLMPASSGDELIWTIPLALPPPAWVPVELLIRSAWMVNPESKVPTIVAAQSVTTPARIPSAPTWLTEQPWTMHELFAPNQMP